MSIKKNMKRRILMVVALAMTLAVLAAGTAHAAAFAVNACEPPNRTILTHEPNRYVWWTDRILSTLKVIGTDVGRISK